MRNVTAILLTVVILTTVGCTPQLTPGEARGGLFDRKSTSVSKKNKAKNQPPKQYVSDPVAVVAPDTSELSALADAVGRAEQSADTVVVDVQSEDTLTEEPRAVAPSHNFEAAETEHVKISRYDPFGGKNRFAIELDASGGVYPYPGKLLSGYGYRGRSMHSGVDIKGVPGDTIRSVFDGVVRMSKPYSGYGNVVVVRHENGLETLYSHNQRNLVRVGDKVRAGQALALVGRTGRATTEHCHFELRVQGQHMNPLLLLDCQAQTLRGGVLVVSRNGTTVTGSNKTAKSSTGQPRDAAPAASDVQASRDPEAVKSTTSTASSPSSAPAPTAPAVHIVVKGDTLSAIAVRYRTTVSKLCALNNISKTSTLSLKQKIKLR